MLNNQTLRKYSFFGISKKTFDFLGERNGNII
jgi:hypothetical protein